MEYRSFAENFAKQAGEIIQKNFRLGMDKEWKEDNTPVTATDIEINDLLLDSVAKEFPGHNVLAEEKSRLGKDSEFVWVCDPVDGTIPFSAGIPICTFSLALVKNGESILGVVADPLGDRFFIAEKGQGAFLNGAKIRVSTVSDLRGQTANCDTFETAYYDSYKLSGYLRMVKGVKLLTLCSFVYSAVLAAAGELAFSIFPHTTAHDAAAVKIIVEEAGGKVTDLFGNEQRYDKPINGALVSNGFLHGKLTDLIKKMVFKNMNF